jgi:UDP-N-acetylglucosamine 2-epimerase (non-hydrolysing)
MNKRIAVVVGTRPEAIKLAPVIRALNDSAEVDCFVIDTGQHPTLAKDMLAVFGVEPDISLRVFSEGQSLSRLNARILEELGQLFSTERFDWVVVQGDTTSAFSGALAAFYAGIPVAHVEAGLRTATIDSPFPEEMNRRLISRIASAHFAPTKAAAECLLSEGVAPESVYMVGNTVVDSAKWIVAHKMREARAGGRYILCTMHRRENWDEGIDDICAGIERLVSENLIDYDFVFIKHPNPAVAHIIEERLGKIARVTILPPQEYADFLTLLSNCEFVISDSGGVVEEAPTFGKHVLIARDETERKEAVEMGLATLVGTDTRVLVDKAVELAGSASRAATRDNPFGDGHSSARIAAILTAG